MKIPKKTIMQPDWDALWELLQKDGVVFVEDMSHAETRTFNVWARRFHRRNIKYVSLLTGGMQVAVGSHMKEGTKP